MRKDMHKLLCERPRAHSKDRDRDRDVPARTYSRNLEIVRGEDEDGEYIESNSPKSMKMGKGYRGHGTKELNENLNPFYRWLEKQVNRPWDKVYSEIRERLDVRDAVQLHIMQHLWQYVEKDIEIIDGVVCRKGQAYFWNRFRDGDLYIHPVTGILCRNKVKKPHSKNKKEATEWWVGDGSQTRLYKIDGIWYMVHKTLQMERNWWPSLYPKEVEGFHLNTKQQLSKKDLRHYGLENDRVAA